MRNHRHAMHETTDQVESRRPAWIRRVKIRARQRYEAQKREVRSGVVRTRQAYGRRRGHARLG